MNVVGIPTNLGEDELIRLLQHRSNNEELLSLMYENIQYVQLPDEPAARVYIPSISIAFPSTTLNLPRHMFLTAIDNMMQEAVLQRSMSEAQPTNAVKPVSPSFGRQFYMTRKLLKTMKEAPPRCSICLEELLPEDKTRKKVWQLHGPQCTFHIGCLKRWHKESSKCPNCNLDCSE